MAGFQELKRTIQSVEGESTRPNITADKLTGHRHQRYGSYDTTCSIFCDHSLTTLKWTHNLCGTLIIAQLVYMWHYSPRLAKS